jgi:hypothetical protein
MLSPLSSKIIYRLLQFRSVVRDATWGKRRKPRWPLGGSFNDAIPSLYPLSRYHRNLGLSRGKNAPNGFSEKFLQNGD